MKAPRQARPIEGDANTLNACGKLPFHTLRSERYR